MYYDCNDLIDDINKVLCLPISKIADAIEAYDLLIRSENFYKNVNKLTSQDIIKLEAEESNRIVECSFKLLMLKQLAQVLMQVYSSYVEFVESEELGSAVNEKSEEFSIKATPADIFKAMTKGLWNGS